MIRKPKTFSQQRVCQKKKISFLSGIPVPIARMPIGKNFRTHQAFFSLFK
ncbi:hypothetical protein HMPREF3038_02976 [Akkermansia sp. KLE1797]|nr:hypothetical protein HMPREF3038_02976 [Akkermansia sp. KLE1797]